MVNVKSKGNRYQKKIRDILQHEYIDEYNRRWPEQYLYLVETFGRDTFYSPADFIVYQRYKGNDFPILFIECKHVKKATNAMKRQWWEHLNRNNGIIIYKEHGRREDMVVFDGYLGERPLREWIKISLGGDE